MQKPGYTTTKRAFWLSSALAWIVILALTVGAIRSGAVIAYAQIALPMMVGLIAVMLGIHRGLGSLDMWTLARHRPDEAGSDATPATQTGSMEGGS